MSASSKHGPQQKDLNIFFFCFVVVEMCFAVVGICFVVVEMSFVVVEFCFVGVENPNSTVVSACQKNEDFFKKNRKKTDFF